MKIEWGKVGQWAMWAGGGVAAFFGVGYLISQRDSGGGSGDAVPAAAQMPMFVQSGGGGFAGGGGSGVMPALPQAAFPEMPQQQAINMPAFAGTNEYDVMVAQYGYAGRSEGFATDRYLADLTFDMLKYGMENSVTGVSAGGTVTGNGWVTGSVIYDTPDLSKAVSSRTGSVGSVIGTGGSSGRVSGVASAGSTGTVIGTGGSSGRTAATAQTVIQPGLSVSTVSNLFQTMSASQAELELYQRAQQVGASNQQVAYVLNQANIAPGKVFSATDIENWKYERGLS